MKAQRVSVRTFRTLQEPVLGVPADKLIAHTQAKLDALPAQSGKDSAEPKANPAPRPR